MNSDHFLWNGELEIQKEGGFVSTSNSLSCLTTYWIKINSYIINKFFLIASFYSLKIYKLINYVVNNIQFIQNLICVLWA